MTSFRLWFAYSLDILVAFIPIEKPTMQKDDSVDLKVNFTFIKQDLCKKSLSFIVSHTSGRDWCLNLKFFFLSFENPILQGTKKEIVRLCSKGENHPFTRLRDNLFFRMIKEYEVIRWLNISICLSNIQFVWSKYDS